MLKMRSYIKKELGKNDFKLQDLDRDSLMKKNVLSRNKMLATVGAMVLVASFLFIGFTNKGFDNISLGEEGSIEMFAMPMATTTKKGVIAIPPGTVKANPFLPYKDFGDTEFAIDVPAYNLVEPPEVLEENSDAARVMDTIVSGILYDKYSPSAILNIEGNDYLVKKGDVVNNYKVLSILEDSVTVKLGANVYKAGIGEILTEGAVNHNNVSNLNNKFGGVQ